MFSSFIDFFFFRTLKNSFWLHNIGNRTLLSILNFLFLYCWIQSIFSFYMFFTDIQIIMNGSGKLSTLPGELATFIPSHLDIVWIPDGKMILSHVKKPYIVDFSVEMENLLEWIDGYGYSNLDEINNRDDYMDLNNNNNNNNNINIKPKQKKQKNEKNEKNENNENDNNKNHFLLNDSDIEAIKNGEIDPENIIHHYEEDLENIPLLIVFLNNDDEINNYLMEIKTGEILPLLFITEQYIYYLKDEETINYSNDIDIKDQIYNNIKIYDIIIIPWLFQEICEKNKINENSIYYEYGNIYNNNDYFLCNQNILKKNMPKLFNIQNILYNPITQIIYLTLLLLIFSLAIFYFFTNLLFIMISTFLLNFYIRQNYPLLINLTSREKFAISTYAYFPTLLFSLFPMIDISILSAIIYIFWHHSKLDLINKYILPKLNNNEKPYVNINNNNNSLQLNIKIPKFYNHNNKIRCKILYYDNNINEMDNVYNNIDSILINEYKELIIVDLLTSLYKNYNNTDTTLNLSGLEINKLYIFRVQFDCGFGFGDLSNISNIIKYE